MEDRLHTSGLQEDALVSSGFLKALQGGPITTPELARFFGEPFVSGDATASASDDTCPSDFSAFSFVTQTEGILFEAVQLSGVYADNKTIVDARCATPPLEMLRDLRRLYLTHPELRALSLATLTRAVDERDPSLIPDVRAAYATKPPRARYADPFVHALCPQGADVIGGCAVVASAASAVAEVEARARALARLLSGPLRRFMFAHFETEEADDSGDLVPTLPNMEDHVEFMWARLSRNAGGERFVTYRRKIDAVAGVGGPASATLDTSAAEEDAAAKEAELVAAAAADDPALSCDPAKEGAVCGRIGAEAGKERGRGALPTGRTPEELRRAVRVRLLRNGFARHELIDPALSAACARDGEGPSSRASRSRAGSVSRSHSRSRSRSPLARARALQVAAEFTSEDELTSTIAAALAVDDGSAFELDPA